MVSVESSFLLIAVIIFAGFFGAIIFKKTRVSDILLLMLLGLLIGPILNILDATTIALIKSLAPFIASLVLIMLLFESSIKLNFFKVINELKISFIFTILVFLSSAIATAAIMALLGWSIFQGLILGVILGGTCSAIVIPLINRTFARQETKIMLSLESAITDVLSIILTITLIGIALNSSIIDAQKISQDILGAFAIAGMLGIVFALIWLSLLRDSREIREREYVLTIGILFAVFFLAEFVHSNGAIAALVFGLVLGNSKEIMGFLQMKEMSLDTKVSLFQEEISFFIRAFFFIYIGIIFELSLVTTFVFYVAIALSIGLLITRAIITKILCRFFKNEKEDYRLIAIMVPRGLAAAVLASYPLTMGIDGNFAVQTIQIVFLIILFSNIITTIGILFNEKKTQKKQNPAEKEELEEIIAPNENKQ